MPNFSIYSTNTHHEYKLDGIIFRNYQYDFGLISYFEVSNSGFFEAGLSQTISHPPKDELGFPIAGWLYLTNIIGYQMLLFEFSKKYFELANYNDEVMYQLSFKNVLNLQLANLHYNYRSRGSSSDNDPTNRQHDNFKINCIFNPSKLNNEEIISIAKSFSEKICRVFGYEQDMCFIDNELSISHLTRFSV